VRNGRFDARGGPHAGGGGEGGDAGLFGFGMNLCLNCGCGSILLSHPKFYFQY
jgi:hypothetical protein